MEYHTDASQLRWERSPIQMERTLNTVSALMPLALPPCTVLLAVSNRALYVSCRASSPDAWKNAKRCGLDRRCSSENR